MGSRISNMTLTRTGEPIEANRTYVVAGWASVNEGVEGPPVYDLVNGYIERVQEVGDEPRGDVVVMGL